MPSATYAISNISVHWAAQAAIKPSKFNCCHLSQIKDDAGELSVPVWEFNPIASPPLS